MDLQPDDPKTLANSPSSTPPLTASSTPASSIPTLRFPRPEGSQKLANWISTSSPDIRRPPSMADMSNLADSAYEIINNTDSESQDGQLSESTGSLSVSRPDDVHSLDGSEQPYDSESDDEPIESEPANSHASLQYADQALQSPSTHISAHTLRYSAPSLTIEGQGAAPGSIEFREDTTPDPDKISVSHVIREHTEEESAALAERLNIPTSPRRLVTTVRQTMSHGYLSTKEPLRVLYVGHAGVMRQIVIKVSNAIWASPNSAAPSENARGKQREGVYNIVPIASFGDAPELDLMEASHCQIKVEHCTSAYEFSQRDRDTGSPLFDITIDHDREKMYRCCRSPTGTYVSPSTWTPPHIAIFFYADDEDEDERQTRKAAWNFLKHMGVPAIIISETSLIGQPSEENWAEYIDERSAHLCLESRDPERPLAPQRAPIDLVSFTNIDARQMNRNLALVTGVLETPKDQDTSAGMTRAATLKATLRKTWRQRPTRDEVFQSIESNKWFVAVLVPVIMAFLAPLLASVFSGIQGGNVTSIQPGAVSDILDLSSAPSTGQTSATTGSVATSTSTVVINVTSTKTVQIVRAMPSTSSVASALSFAGFLSDKPSGAPAEPKLSKTTCSVEKHSSNELLIKIPSESKTYWLAKEAITIDVHRGEQRLKTKLSVIDEGMLVEFEHGDAHGPLNVSVVTTRRPKINETFEVDFGKPIAAEILDYGRRVLNEIAERALTSDVIEKKYPELKSKVLEARDQAYDRVQNWATPEARDLVRQSQIFLKKHWIGLRFSKEEMEQYARKAKKAEALRKGRVETKPRSFFWSKDATKPDQAESKDSGWKKMIKG